MKWEDYKNKREIDTMMLHNQKYIKTNIECPICGSPIYQNVTIVLASYPPQYQFTCKNCNWSGTSY